MDKIKIKILHEIKEKNLRYNYEVKDIKEFDCKELINSDDITDNIIAILCNIKDIDLFLEKLKEKLLNIESKKREDYLRKLFYLSRLRPKLYEKIEKKQSEELPMPFTIEKERDPLYQDGRLQGKREGAKQATKKTKIAIAKALLKKGITVKDIIDVTGLTKEEIKKLKV